MVRADEDIEHAMRHALAIHNQDDDTRLYLGPARSAGHPITDELVEKLAGQGGAGYDVEETIRRAGGPSMGSSAASVESVRLDPELREALAQRAEQDHDTTSSVVRKALREYLGPN